MNVSVYSSSFNDEEVYIDEHLCGTLEASSEVSSTSPPHRSVLCNSNQGIAGNKVKIVSQP